MPAKKRAKLGPARPMGGEAAEHDEAPPTAQITKRLVFSNLPPSLTRGRPISPPEADVQEDAPNEYFEEQEGAADGVHEKDGVTDDGVAFEDLLADSPMGSDSPAIPERHLDIERRFAGLKNAGKAADLLGASRQEGNHLSSGGEISLFAKFVPMLPLPSNLAQTT